MTPTARRIGRLPLASVLAASVVGTALAGDDHGWSTTLGAVSGPGPTGTVAILSEGAVALEGDAATRRFPMLTRPTGTGVGTSVRLSGEARLLRGRLDAGQRDNSYVALRYGEVTERADVRREDWEPFRVVATPTEAPALVWIFLSHTGRLEVRDLRVDPLGPADAFPAMIDHLARTYSFLDAKKVDLAAMATAGKEAFPKDGDPAKFLEAAKKFLSALKDEHVWLQLPGGPIVPTHVSDAPLNADFRTVAKRVTDLVACGSAGFAGRLGDDVGYVAFASLAAPAADAERLERAFVALLDRKGLLLDLRANSGGDERQARALLARLTDKPIVYARRQVRNGPRPTDFTLPMDAVLAPGPGPVFAGPVVVLIGPRCVSSGEGMAQMLAALPRATLLGLPTRGASGSPKALRLPNGVTLWSSTWVDLLPDGSSLEGHGVPPGVRFEPTGPGDPTLEAGLRLLREQLAK